MHTFEKITIENFKSIEKLELYLGNYTPIVGYNNAGKSNILEAIDWYLNEYGLTKEMFRNSDIPVSVTGYITGISDQLLDELDDKHKKQIEKYIVDGKATFRLIQSKPGGGKTLRKLYVRNPEIEDDKNEDAFTGNPSGIRAALSKLFPESIFIRAMEDATDDLTKNKTTTTIGKLIKQITDPVKNEHEEQINDILKNIENLFSAEGENRVESFKDFDEKANDNISDFFPGISLKLHIPSPTIDDIFKQGTVKYSENDTTLRDFSLLGHGAQRSIQMALVKLLSEFNFSDDANSRKFLLIEEPELYLHPKGILTLRNALKKLSLSGYQVLFATHSPLIITKNDIADTNLIRKSKDKKTYTLKSMRESVKEVIEEHKAQSDVLFELTNSTKLLFADKVVLVEGKTEIEFLPKLYELITEIENTKSNVTFISINGSGSMYNSIKILNAMKLNNGCLVDLDYCFKEAKRKGLLSPEDEDINSIKSLFVKYKEEGKYNIDEQGLPCKNTQTEIPAKKAYELISKKDEAKEYIENLKNKMKSEGYWVWSKGDIENIIGIKFKNKYDDKLKELNQSKNWKDCIEEPIKLEEFFKWVNSTSE